MRKSPVSALATVVAAGLLVGAGAMPAAAARPCGPALYTVIDPAGGIGAGDPLAVDVIAGEREVEIPGLCAPIAPARFERIEKGVTRLKANWPSCQGFRGKVLLRGKIQDGCTRMVAKLKAPEELVALKLPFEATFVLPPVVELPALTKDDIAASPTGEAMIVGGHLIVQFEPSVGLAEIDATLAAAGLERVGYLELVNQVTAQIIDGQSELEAQLAIEALPGVEVAALDFLVFDQRAVGTAPPVTDQLVPPRAPRNRVVKPTLSNTELLRNWPHYAMDTLPGLAIADEILGEGAVSHVALAIVERNGFQPAKSKTDRESLLSSKSKDKDLAPKVVDPTGIVVTGLSAQIKKGRKRIQDNTLIGTVGRDTLHGLEVASAGLAAGQDLIGTGRHAAFRPVLIRQDLFGVCRHDRSIACEPLAPGTGGCPISAGECDSVTNTSFLGAAFAALAGEVSSTVRVVNVSLQPTEDINDTAQIARSRKIFEAPLRALASDKIVVLAAGNATSRRPPVDIARISLQSLGPLRSVARAGSADPLDRHVMVIASTSLPSISYGDLGKLKADPFYLPTLEFREKDGSPKLERFFSVASNFGANVSASAPGEYVSVLNNDFRHSHLVDGTSFSAPYVAGLAAEMLSLDGSVPLVEVIRIIERSADPLGTPDNFGHGRINVWKAILTLLNRKRPDEPRWLGIRFRSLEVKPPAGFRIKPAGGGPAIPAKPIHRRRVHVANVPRGDNSGEVPFVPKSGDFETAVQFSFETADLALRRPGVALLEGRKKDGTPVYQLPVLELRDLTNALALELPDDFSLDDHVLSIQANTRTSFLWGQVTAKGVPQKDARITYENYEGVESFAVTDRQGFYRIYDAPVLKQIEVTVLSDGFASESTQVETKGAFLAKKKHFDLTDLTGPPNAEEYDLTQVGAATFQLDVTRVPGGDNLHINSLNPGGLPPILVGGFDGRKFSLDYGGGTEVGISTITGSVTGTIAEDFRKLEDFQIEWTRIRTFTGLVDETISFAGANLPLNGFSPGELQFRMSGPDTCAFITSLSYSRFFQGNLIESVDDFACVDFGDAFWIQFQKPNGDRIFPIPND